VVACRFAGGGRTETDSKETNMAKQIQNPLLTSYRLGDLALRNRIVMAPLTRTRAQNAAHVPNGLMVEYYAQRASAGLIITEGTWVSEEAQGWYGVPGIYNEEQGRAWRKVTDAVHQRGGLIFAQLWHQGGVSHHSFFPAGRQPVAPSAIDMEQLVYVHGGTAMSEVPSEMSREDIRRTVADYSHASLIARDAGFDGVQLQAGYVYLINQFLHETTNRRTDEYGGSIENRSRFLFEVLDAVLEVWPSQRVGVKNGPMMNERGTFRAVESTLAVSEYVYDRLRSYDLSHILLMRQNADLTGTPIEGLSGDAVIHHFRKRYDGSLIREFSASLRGGVEGD
jgi:N-ethylmaleimide reductase